MPRIQDIGAFNAVRESGLAKLLPPFRASPSEWAPAAEETARKACITHFSETIERSGANIVLRLWAALAPAFRSRWSACACPGPLW